MFSIVIVTYNREEVLIDTLRALMPLRDSLSCETEVLVIDQTKNHKESTLSYLQAWDQDRSIRWLRLDAPHLTRAMNTGLLQSRGDVVLFVDDDIIPFPQLLVHHLDAHNCFQEAGAVVGMVLQPGQNPCALPARTNRSLLWRDLDFPFNSTLESWVDNVIACNLSVKRQQALSIGGFDEAFPPPVAFRFESEFAKRLIRAGGRIRFSPAAAIYHLAASSGGTRSLGSQLTSASPRYGVGDFYFALRCGRGWDRIIYLLYRPFRQVRTRFHLRHPWWIPVKLLGEIRALIQAFHLAQYPQQLISPE